MTSSLRNLRHAAALFALVMFVGCDRAASSSGDSSAASAGASAAASVSTPANANANANAPNIAPGPKAQQLLANTTYNWLTSYTEHARLHLPGGAQAQSMLPMLVDSVEAVRTELLTFLGEGEQSGEPLLELFFVDSREQMRQFVGTPVGGFSQAGERTAGFVASSTYPPPLRHEMVLILAFARWGELKSSVWLAEGLAALAQGSCQGKSIDALAAGYLKRGMIPQLWELSARFRELPDFSGYMASASVIDFVRRKKGVSAVRDLWQGKGARSDNHPLGADGTALEAEWRAELSRVTPATLDAALLRQYGC